MSIDGRIRAYRLFRTLRRMRMGVQDPKRRRVKPFAGVEETIGAQIWRMLCAGTTLRRIKALCDKRGCPAQFWIRKFRRGDYRGYKYEWREDENGHVWIEC